MLPLALRGWREFPYGRRFHMAKKHPTWANFLNSGFYNSSGVAALQNQLGNYSLDRTALGNQADLYLQPQFNTQQLALQQDLQRTMTGYNNQLTGMEQNLALQQRSTNSQYDKSGNDAFNQLGKRGLGRSSIVATTLNSIESARNQALTDLSNKFSDTRNDIQANMSLAQQQNSASLRGLSDNFALQRTAKAEELYNANLAAQTNLQVQIAQLLQAGYQAYRDQWNKDHPKKSGGSSRRGSSNTSPSPSPAPGPNPFSYPSTETNNFGKERY